MESDNAGLAWLVAFCLIISVQVCTRLLVCLLITIPFAIAISVMFVIGNRDDDETLIIGGYAMIGFYAFLWLCLYICASLAKGDD